MQIDPMFQTSQDMMKPTKLLIIDHDVCRYHSFDLLMWLLRQDVLGGDFEHFRSLKRDLWPLVDEEVDLSERIDLLKRQIENINPHMCFENDSVTYDDMASYEAELNLMLADPTASIVPTDVNSRMDSIFNRKDVTGYILRYRNDQNHPSCERYLKVHDTNNVLDLDTEAQLIQDHRINAVMLSMAEQAISLSEKLHEAGYTEHVTFIIARYGYNFIHIDGKPYYPMGNEILGTMELTYGNEYGYFDPFSGITAKRYEEKHNADVEKS